MIDSREAQAALADINEMVARVRQSRIYDIASQIMIAAGVLVLLGNIASYIAPRQGTYIWIGINALGTGVLPNGGNGICLNSSDTTIGGKVPGARNVISGNARPGIFIGNACQRTLVVGNYIGTDPTGTA